jgi:hypothetical protein
MNVRTEENVIELLNDKTMSLICTVGMLHYLLRVENMFVLLFALLQRLFLVAGSD